MPHASQTQAILDRCRELGFALAGVAPAEPSHYSDELQSWLDSGMHGEMDWLTRNKDIRTNPGSIIENARSIICVADRYWAEGSETNPQSNGDSATSAAAAHGRIARYARGEDYHLVMKKRLHALCDELRTQFPDDEFRVCVDTAPLLEREIAQRAGLGAAGKHTLLIEPGVGSYLLLGEVVTSLALAPSSPERRDVCETCTRCIDACPTDAITPHRVDSTRCISYLTIEHRTPIDAKYHEQMGDWIFGCDICQEVCPHNHPTKRTGSAQVSDAYAPRNESFDLLNVLNWDEQARRDALIKSSMKRAKLDMFKRNALIAAGNALRKHDYPTLRTRIEEIAADESEGDLVRATARHVLDAM